MGLSFSFIVLDMVVWFASLKFLPAFLSAVDGTHFGPIALITACVMLGYMHYQACVRSFGLITAMPDRVTRWFGQSSHDCSEDDKHASTNIGLLAKNVESHASNVGQAVMGTKNRNAPPPTDKTSKDPRTKKEAPTPEASTGGGEEPGGGAGTDKGKTRHQPTLKTKKGA